MTAENRHFPPNFFFAISRWIIHFWIIWAQLIFFQKNYNNIFHLTLVIFQIFYYSTKKITSFQCKCKVIFWKKISWSQMIQKCIIQREMAKKNFGGWWRFSAVAVVSPPFLRSSLINIIKATAIPKLTAVTLFLAEFLR